MDLIPKYKRDEYTFVSNLKDITASRNFPLTLRRNGYLLSEHYTDDFYENLAKWVKKRRNLLISDNGNFSRMKDIADNFIEESEQLLDDLENNKISKRAASRKRKELIERIATLCKTTLEQQDKAGIIKNQLKINPDYLIALEDLTIPVLMICGFFDPIFDPKPNEIETFQTNSKKLYQAQRDGHFGSKAALAETHKFHVLHSYDFSSSRQGALLIRQFNPDGVAISFGGAVKSRRWIKNWNLGNSTVSLPEKLPEMYLAIASISLGYLEGNAADTPVHILGIGSPILIALLGLLFSGSKAVSIDSTAPFKDAFQSNLYGSRYGFLKMDMFKVAAYSLIDNDPYSGNTPFYKNFERAFPHNWGKIRSELGVTSSTNVRDLATLLEKENTLVEKYIPFFTKMRAGDDPLIEHLRIARSGHNYWILHNICRAVRERKDNINKLRKWMHYQVKRYKKIAHPKWAKTVEIITNEVTDRI